MGKPLEITIIFFEFIGIILIIVFIMVVLQFCMVIMRHCSDLDATQQLDRRRRQSKNKLKSLLDQKQIFFNVFIGESSIQEDQ